MADNIFYTTMGKVNEGINCPKQECDGKGIFQSFTPSPGATINRQVARHICNKCEHEWLLNQEIRWGDRDKMKSYVHLLTQHS